MVKTATAAPRLKALYNDKFKKELQAELKLSNPHEVPEIEKFVVSVGVGKKKEDKRHFEIVKNTLEKVTGQAPVARLAKKSIATFSIRKGMGAPIGASVTLRGARMYEFMDRLLNIALPRVRDFRGVSDRSFDGMGNYALGIREQLIFPEIDYDKIDRTRGMDITVVTTAGNNDDAHALLTALGFPFKDK